MKIQYASNLMIHRVGGGSPLAVRAPVLVLAGGTGPISNIRVQAFYWWCSKNYDEVFTILDSKDVGQKILPNVYTLNDRTHLLPNGMTITGDKYDTQSDVLVHNAVYRFNPIQIHDAGVFHVALEGATHAANSMTSRRFDPRATLELR